MNQWCLSSSVRMQALTILFFIFLYSYALTFSFRLRLVQYEIFEKRKILQLRFFGGLKWEETYFFAFDWEKWNRVNKMSSMSTKIVSISIKYRLYWCSNQFLCLMNSNKTKKTRESMWMRKNEAIFFFSYTYIIFGDTFNSNLLLSTTIIQNFKRKFIHSYYNVTLYS